jgi:prepilin-type N-terminal cleavage/methylation domain-containing protein
MPNAERTTIHGMGRARRGGFSLAEILIATAILGVGLLMLVGVFPAAIEQNKNSTADVIGTLIVDNSMSIAKIELKHPLIVGGSVIGTTFDSTKMLFDSNSVDTRYPNGDGNSFRGFIMLGRRMDMTTNPSGSFRNDYQIAVVAYLKVNQNDKVMPFLITTKADANATDMSINVSSASANLLKIGSPVIDPATGAYAMIVGIDSASDPNVYLNHSFGTKVAKTAGTIGPIVVVETDWNNIPLSSVPASPATCVLITRTGLRQQ